MMMLRHGLLVVFVFLALILVSVPMLNAEDILVVGSFSSAAEGPLPPTWKPLLFKKQKGANQTEYVVVRDGDTTVVRAESRAAASALVHAIDLDLKDYPVLRWRWKVSNVIASGNLAKKEGDDYAARVYVTFAYEPDKVSFGKKVKYKAARLLFGDLPFGVMTYIWDNQAPIGTVANNAYAGEFTKMIVVQSGEARAGHWVDEERNVYEDYRRAFGEDPPRVNGVAIMTDTDNTGERATAFYGDLVFTKVR